MVAVVGVGAAVVAVALGIAFALGVLAWFPAVVWLGAVVVAVMGIVLARGPLAWRLAVAQLEAAGRLLVQRVMPVPAVPRAQPLFLVSFFFCLLLYLEWMIFLQRLQGCARNSGRF